MTSLSPRLICCHASIDEVLRQCDRCAATMHQGCWKRLGGCCAEAGFKLRPSLRVPEPVQPLSNDAPPSDARLTGPNDFQDLRGCLMIFSWFG